MAAGILASRLVGLLRERVFAHYLGNSMAAAAFKAALRIPNFLQNLFGEGVLSASFIPVYAELLKKDSKEADRVANAIFGLLALATSVLTAAGIFATPLFIDLVAPGFEGESRQLTIDLVRILFPGTGLLVLSAWCLGVLNSHRRFLLSYAAPVLWNCAVIAALVFAAFAGGPEPKDEASFARYAAYGTLAGSALQFAVQLPSVLRLLGYFRPAFDTTRASVRQVLRGFGPVVVGRGVVQVSAYVDTAVASLISERALSALAYAQTLYLIPVSLFGMAVSAAELPAMSQEAGEGQARADALRTRLVAGLSRIAFFVVPSVAALLFLGDVVGGALLQTGRFGAGDTRYLWYLLMGSSVGLLASTLGRLYSSAFYALKDTQTPLRVAAVRVGLSVALAYGLGLYLPKRLGIPEELGAVGITLASGAGAFVEYLLLKRKLSARIGATGLPANRLLKLWGAAFIAAGAGLGAKVVLTRWFGVDPAIHGALGESFLPPPDVHPIAVAALVLGPFGVLYFGLTKLLSVPEADLVFRRLRRSRNR